MFFQFKNEKSKKYNKQMVNSDLYMRYKQISFKKTNSIFEKLKVPETEFVIIYDVLVFTIKGILF